MEIETKFIVPSGETFEDLLQKNEVGAFFIVGGVSQSIKDIYVDTAEWDLYQRGFACRIRWKNDVPLVTVKSLGDAQGALHQRLEYEIPLHVSEEELLSPNLWDDGVARDIVTLTIQDKPLLSWFTVEQRRHPSLARDKAREREIAELSLDEVRIYAGGEEERFWDLEAELLPTGAAKDLRALSAVLQREGDLIPDTRTKFMRGLELLGDARPQFSPAPHFLLPAERAILAQIAKLSIPEAQQRKANILLARDVGKEAAEIADMVGISRGQVQHWLREFQQQRLRIFSDDIRLRGIERASLHLEKTEPKTISEVTEEPQVEVVAPVEEIEKPTSKNKSPGILPNDPMSEAGRKVWLFHFERMLKHEPGTRAGEDIEELHDMRVATRRMRSAFRIFDKYFESDVIAPFLQGLRHTGHALGAVRDLDVFMQKARKYLKTLPNDENDALNPLLNSWQKQRSGEREKMLEYLDSASYQQFVQDFGDFLHTPGQGAKPLKKRKPKPYLVCHVVPRLIYKRYEAVRAYELVLEDAPLDTLHALRIDCKRLRYTLEFFREVLGEEVEDAIGEIVAMQDHLGDLHDADVADNLLRDFLAGNGARKNKDARRVIAPGVVEYLAVKQKELQDLIATFPQAWERMNRAEVRRWLALAVAEL